MASVWAWDYLFIFRRNAKLCGLQGDRLYSRSDLKVETGGMYMAAGRGGGWRMCETVRGMLQFEEAKKKVMCDSYSVCWVLLYLGQWEAGWN